MRGGKAIAAVNFEGYEARIRFFREWRMWGLRVAWSNLRFNLGYRIGGFTSAKR